MLPKNNSAQDNLTAIGEVFLEWTFDEYHKHNKGIKWYIAFFVIALSFLGVALYTSNFFFAVVIILFTGIIFMHDTGEPEDVTLYLGDNGIMVGNKFFRYKDLDSFWIIYEPPHVKSLYFQTKSFVHPRLSIPLGGQDPIAIREFLAERLTENLDEEHEPFSEQVGRILKI